VVFSVGDIVELVEDNDYWTGATGPVVRIDGNYVYADLTLGPNSKSAYIDVETGERLYKSYTGTVRKNSGFYPQHYRLVDPGPDECAAFFT